MIDRKLLRISSAMILSCSILNARAATPPPNTNQSTPRSKPRELPQSIGADTATSEERAQMVEQLWLTPLGKMFHHFLFEISQGESPAELSRRLVDRIHHDVKLTITRMSALNLMIENLYETQKLTPIVHDRITLLETGLALKRQVLQNTAAREFFRFLPVFIGLGFLGGSPLVRQKAADVSGDLWQMLKQIVKRNRVGITEAKRALVTHGRPDALFTKRILDGWSPLAGYFTLWHSFGTSYLFYYVFRTGSADSMAVQNKIWVYGIQRFVSFDEI